MSKPYFVLHSEKLFDTNYHHDKIPIVINFHMKPPLAEKTKVPPNDLRHMTKMATMPIYGTDTSNTFFSITSGPFSQ